MNQQKGKELAQSLEKTISQSDLGSIGIDLAEVTVDNLMKEGFLKDVPIIGSVVALVKTGVAVRDYRFLKKLILFLNESSQLLPKERATIIKNLENEKYRKETGERLISVIDNLETSSKAKLLGKALYLFGKGNITKEDFWRISYVIERLPMEDLLALEMWRNNDLNKVSHIRKHLYLSVGIGWFVLDASSTGFCWEENLCEIFEKQLIPSLQ